jgi:hypothetical protein
METKLPKAIFGSPDRPLRIGNLEIPCYVLEDGKRVLVQGGMLQSLNMSQGTGSRSLVGGDRLTKFIGGKRIKPYVTKELADMIKNPIHFTMSKGGTAYGYEATVLADLCDAVLAAREAGILQPHQQAHIAKQCEILVRGFAKVGIIALVDEATGYQEVRDREALQKILDRYITDEWAKWTKTFPDDFYRHLFRLKGLPYPPPASGKKPSYVGHWTNDIIYSRLAPGVLQALKDKTPRLPSGTRVRKFHQSLTRDYGHPALKEILTNVIFLMRGCTTWKDFKRMLERSAPRYGDTIPMDLDI